MSDQTISNAIQAISDRVGEEKSNSRNGAGGREYALALTKLDEAFMWLVTAQKKVESGG